MLARAQPSAIVSAVEQETTEVGNPPALEGRWLLLSTLGSGGTGGRRQADAVLWEVRHIDGHLRLTQRSVDPPGGKLAFGSEPTPADLRAIATGWDTLAVEPRGVAHAVHDILGGDASDVGREPNSAGALWVVRQTFGLTPGTARPLKEIRVLAARSEDASGYRGTLLTVVFAAAPMPIPIKVEGSFRLLRLPEPSRSPWARVWDVFRGCN